MWKKCIYSFIFGFIFCATILFTVFILPGNERDREYKTKQQELISTNRELGKSISDREKNIIGLRFNNKQFEQSIDKREAIIKRTRDIIKSTDDSISKLEYILSAFNEIEKGSYSHNNL